MDWWRGLGLRPAILGLTVWLLGSGRPVGWSLVLHVGCRARIGGFNFQFSRGGEVEFGDDGQVYATCLQCSAEGCSWCLCCASFNFEPRAWAPASRIDAIVMVILHLQKARDQGQNHVHAARSPILQLVLLHGSATSCNKRAFSVTRIALSRQLARSGHVCGCTRLIPRGRHWPGLRGVGPLSS
jgi:hypothetical protein